MSYDNVNDDDWDESSRWRVGHRVKFLGYYGEARKGTPIGATGTIVTVMFGSDSYRVNFGHGIICVYDRCHLELDIVSSLGDLAKRRRKPRYP